MEPKLKCWFSERRYIPFLIFPIFRSNGFDLILEFLLFCVISQNTYFSWYQILLVNHPQIISMFFENPVSLFWERYNWCKLVWHAVYIHFIFTFFALWLCCCYYWYHFLIHALFIYISYSLSILFVNKMLKWIITTLVQKHY